MRLTVSVVCGRPLAAAKALRPIIASTAAMTAQMSMTTNADQACPMACAQTPPPGYRQEQQHEVSAQRAPANMPTPFPARVAVCVASALASASSWRTSSERSLLTSPNNSPNDGAGASGSSGRPP